MRFDHALFVLPGLLRREQRRLDQIFVPAHEVDGDLAARRQRVPVAPHRRQAVTRLLARLLERVHANVLGIEPFQKLIDDLAAARGGKPGDDDGQREILGLLQPGLRTEQRIPQRRQLPVRTVPCSCGECRSPIEPCASPTCGCAPAAPAQGNLLSDAVNVAAAKQDLACLDADQAALEEQLLQLLRGELVALRDCSGMTMTGVPM